MLCGRAIIRAGGCYDGPAEVDEEEVLFDDAAAPDAEATSLGKAVVVKKKEDIGGACLLPLFYPTRSGLTSFPQWVGWQ